MKVSDMMETFMDMHKKKKKIMQGEWLCHQKEKEMLKNWMKAKSKLQTNLFSLVPSVLLTENFRCTT